jgi:hypothetical protein
MEQQVGAAKILQMHNKFKCIAWSGKRRTSAHTEQEYAKQKGKRGNFEMKECWSADQH